MSSTIRISTVDIGQRLDEDRKRHIRTGCWAFASFSAVAMLATPFVPEKRFIPWVVGAGQIAAGVGLIAGGSTLSREKGFEKAEEILVRKNYAHEMATSHVAMRAMQSAAVQSVISGNIQPALPPAQSQQVPAQQREDREVVQPMSNLSSTSVDNQITREPGNQHSANLPDYQWEYATHNSDIELFDWSLFNQQPEKYPHIFIVGGTGDGKSFTAESLAALLDGQTIVSHPHRRPSDFVNFPVYCAGRNYGDYSKDKAVDFASLVTGKDGSGKDINPLSVSCATFIKTLCSEMDRRFGLYALGNENYPMVNIILDETNTMLSELLSTGKSSAGKTVTQDFASLVREARKVKLRLFALVQGDNVEELSLKGQGNLRKSFRYVRLGGFARNHAKRIGGSTLEWVNNQQHPMMSEDEPAAIAPELVAKVQQSINQKLTIEPAEVIEPKPATNLNPREWPAVIYPGQLQQLPAHRQGVYAVFVGNHLVYIGESSDLWRRWNWREKPHHIRKDLDRTEEVVKIHFYTLESGTTEKERKDLETQLQIEFNPPWNGTSRHELPASEPREENTPQISVEDLLQLVFDFAKEHGECTVREVQNLYRIGQKYKLKAPAIKGIFKELENRGLGSVSEETVQGQTQVKFVVA